MALSFDNGSSEYLNGGTASDLDITGALSLGGWFNFPSLGIFKDLVQKYFYQAVSPFGNTGYMLQVTSGNKIVGYAGVNTSTDRHYRIGNTALTTDTWYHIMYTFTPSDAIRIYLNGVEDTPYTTSGTCPAALGTSATPLYIAYLDDASGSSDRWATMRAYDVRLHNVVLTAAEIRSIYAARGSDAIRRGLVRRFLLIGEGGLSASATLPDIAKAAGATPVNTPTFLAAPFKRRRGA